MTLGVFTPVFGNYTLKEAIEFLKNEGVSHIELGAGGFPGKAHANPAELLADRAKLDELKKLLKENDITVDAVSAHGNPLHPDKTKAKEFDDDFKNAILLAEELGVTTIIGFSGCPGDSEGSKYPNWVTCCWPYDFQDVVDYQWNEVAIPYWKKTAEFAKAHGIEKIAFEMHPGFIVYNPQTLLRLREAVGDIIGANVDPSHLFWQGIDPVAAIRELKGAIYHFHAKDTKIDERKRNVNGVLSHTTYDKLTERPWVFRTVGYGHGETTWRDIISELKLNGYDGAISIEHEDALMSPEEGLRKAIAFLKDILIYENADGIWW